MVERRLGQHAELVESPAGPHVHAKFGTSSKVLIVGHHDTVFPLGALAQRPFTVDGGRATGPGVFDMKAGIILAVHALTLLDDRDGVELLITSDEEVGSKASRALIEERALACGAVLVMEPSADGGALKTARKGTGTFEVTVHGRAAHAGLEPEKGINSLVAAAQLITRIATFGDPQTGTTVTPTVATSGTADNVVPAMTRVRVDARVVAAGEKERVEVVPIHRGQQPIHDLSHSDLLFKCRVCRRGTYGSLTRWRSCSRRQVCVGTRFRCTVRVCPFCVWILRRDSTGTSRTTCST